MQTPQPRYVGCPPFPSSHLCSLLLDPLNKARARGAGLVAVILLLVSVITVILFLVSSRVSAQEAHVKTCLFDNLVDLGVALRNEVTYMDPI